MPADFLKSERRWIVIIPVAIIVVSVVVWFVTRETLPKTIRIATAQDGGLYHEFGEALQKSLEERTGRKVELIQTEGSVENAKLLREGEADVAIVQGGSSSFDDLSVIAPLYPEVVHILARSNLSLDSVADLKSHRVVFGPSGSGMRASAERLLEHYGILGEVTDSSDVYFKGFLDQVTEIKLKALTQLTHEELRSDQAFSIFILQCGNLISKIQMKILNCPSP
ncbi:TAXI family TRAP transporter solute-binding subunit, partial [Akkermansiaceae bacterium]|nr:TAXI family TRAP transporter solute-binding subunit [Akkermansiaceae bacterium]MDC0550077.1 TAXI family TRAP transporter solute-binding subunit [bacterium]